MRATKLVLAFLLSLALAAPPGLAAQSRGKGPDKGQGPDQGRAKVEKPQKPPKAKKPEARPSRPAQKPKKAAPDRDRRRDLRDDTRRVPENADRRTERRAPVFRDQRRPAPRPQPDRVVRDIQDRRDGNLRFRGMDTNGDRRISRSEWRGNDVSFSNHDWNGDGILSGSEVIPGGRTDRVTRDRVRIRDRDRRGDLRFDSDRLGHRIALVPSPLRTRIDRHFDLTRGDLTRDLTRDVTRRFGADPVRHRSPEPGMVRLDFGLDLDPVHGFHRAGAPSESLLDRLALPLTLMVTEALLSDVDAFVTMERFASYDRDFDGYLAPAEWPAGRVAFDRYDLDDDGYLVSRELYADDDLIVIDRDRLLLFQGIDRDGDGLVAPWEWPGDLDSFWFRDHNADGAVSLDEYLGLDVDLPVRNLSFDAVDYDRDGEIARVEWVGDPYRFQRLDRNDNGVVGRWEYAFGWLRGA